jgi:hypothetical protein
MNPQDSSSPIRVDWRTRIVTYLAAPFHSPSGKTYPAGTPVKLATLVKHQSREISITDPSPPALFLNRAIKSYNEAGLIHPLKEENFKNLIKGDNSEQAFNYLEAMMACIVFSFTALEAFANELIPEDYHRNMENEDGVSIPRGKDWIENHTSLDEKLSRILPEVIFTKPKGKKSLG